MPGKHQSDTHSQDMQDTEHFYRCFGCAKEHPTEDEAITCCSVVQEIWRCRCGELFASVTAVFSHLQESGHRSASFDPQQQVKILTTISEASNAKAI